MSLAKIYKIAKVAPIVTLAAFIGGCGGGGGGGDSAGVTQSVSFVKWSSINPPATVSIKGISQDADYTASAPSFNATSVTDLGVDTTASAYITYRFDDTISRISITTQNGTVTWDENSGDLIDDTDPLAVVAASGSNQSMLFTVNPVALSWDYQTFGTWQTGIMTGSGQIGAVSLGAPTAGSAIPTSGTASFTGAAMGIYVDVAGAQYLAGGDLTVNADFVGRSLTFATTNSEKLNLLTSASSLAPNLDLSGTLNYAAGVNTFTGSLTAAGGMTGQTEGRFYGPNAEELGGVFSVSGAGTESYIGSYGAAQ